MVCVFLSADPVCPPLASSGYIRAYRVVSLFVAARPKFHLGVFYMTGPPCMIKVAVAVARSPVCAPAIALPLSAAMSTSTERASMAEVESRPPHADHPAVPICGAPAGENATAQLRRALADRAVARGTRCRTFRLFGTLEDVRRFSGISPALPLA